MLHNIDNKVYDAVNNAESAIVSLEEWIDDYCENETEKKRRKRLWNL